MIFRNRADDKSNDRAIIEKRIAISFPWMTATGQAPRMRARDWEVHGLLHRLKSGLRECGTPVLSGSSSRR